VSDDLRPLVVGLDRTLVRTSTVVETWLSAGRNRPWILALVPFWLLRGRGHLQARLAERARMAPETLPYDPELVAYLREQRAAGRPIHLATSAHRSIAEPVARHLDLFDRLYASDETAYLGGRAKARKLAEDFGAGGFTYVGRDGDDPAVWTVAGSAVLISATPGRARRVMVPVEAEFSRPRGRLRALLRALRSYQWVKNVLVFIPLVTANGLGRLDSVLALFGIVDGRTKDRHEAITQKLVDDPVVAVDHLDHEAE